MDLRPYGDDDLALTTELETDPVVKCHLGGVLTTAEAAAVHRDRVAAAALGDRFWTVVPATGAEAVGVVGIWSTPWGDGVVDEVGWMLVPAAHGRGYGRWAAGAVVRQARLDDRYAEIHAFPAAANAASNAICRSLRFRRLDDVDLDYVGRPLRCAHWTLDVSG
jgi:RimJ/RimL family protein N-acetyltransferase